MTSAAPASPSFLQRWRHTRRVFQRLRHGAARPPAGYPVKVSVMIVTFNHERYIAQALDGVLMQERDFDIEINVHDDASTDRTQAIVRDYQRRFPHIVRCLFNPVNVGHVATQLNTYRGFQNLRGEYFAMLEGDDYWTDPRKLRRQVAFLDAHPDYVACGHDTLKVYDDGSRAPEHFFPVREHCRERASIVDMINMNTIYHFNSVLYRNVFGSDPPLCLSDPYSCEVTIQMAYACRGDFHYMRGYMSSYRMHGAGVFSRRSVEDHWVFHLHGYQRFALYLGLANLEAFAGAMSRFILYALLAHRRGMGPSLRVPNRALFAAHLAVVYPLWKALEGMHGAQRSLLRLRHGFGARAILLQGARNAGQSGYRSLVWLTPRWMVQALRRLEARHPALTRARRKLVYGQQRQET
jgi:glycosyltransferase involved in cell wall biosynthesis